MLIPNFDIHINNGYDRGLGIMKSWTETLTSCEPTKCLIYFIRFLAPDMTRINKSRSLWAHCILVHFIAIFIDFLLSVEMLLDALSISLAPN